jgi:succinoglycan biosynthesis protein ExoA
MMALHGRPSACCDAPVLVVIPCLNEEKHIEQVVTQLAAEADRVDLHIVVADGGSTDQTRSIVQRLVSSKACISLLDNPKRIQSAGVNAAVRKYGGNAQFLIRVDAHASYSDHYCETLLKEQNRTRADSVVVAMHAVGHACFQRAAAAAQNSIIGNGGATHRNESNARWTDHGHHALMTLEAFNAVGGYDETFSHVEDVELDVRLSKQGFRLYLTDETQVTYYPRISAAGLFRQYFNIGRGRARYFLKHRKHAKIRHLGLAVVAPTICLLTLIPVASAFAMPALAWISLCIAYGIGLGVRSRDACAATAGIAAIAMQAGWSFGFFLELSFALFRRVVVINSDAEPKLKRQSRV